VDRRLLPIDDSGCRLPNISYSFWTGRANR
jgi:hypothetical protein